MAEEHSSGTPQQCYEVIEACNIKEENFNNFTVAIDHQKRMIGGDALSAENAEESDGFRCDDGDSDDNSAKGKRGSLQDGDFYDINSFLQQSLEESSGTFSAKRKFYLSRDPIDCLFCNTKLIRFDSLAKHIKTFHESFLKHVVDNGEAEDEEAALRWTTDTIKFCRVDSEKLFANCRTAFPPCQRQKKKRKSEEESTRLQKKYLKSAKTLPTENTKLRTKKKKKKVVDLKLSPGFPKPEDKRKELGVFYFQYDEEKQETRYFCSICRRYGKATPGNRFKHEGDYVHKGVCVDRLPRNKDYYFQRHLLSAMHRLSVKDQENDSFCRVEKGLPTKNDQETATMNLCIAIQYIVDCGMSFSHITNLVALLDKISSDDYNPLGNQNHSVKNVPDLIMSNFESAKSTVCCELNKVNLLTRHKRIHIITLGKGTATYDATRQVIIDTFISNDGFPKEHLLSAGRIFDHSAKGAFENMTEFCEKFIELNNIVAICTNGENEYEGGQNGFYIQLLNSSNYSSKIIHLPYLWQRVECLISGTMPEWVTKSLDVCRNIAFHLETRLPLTQKLSEFSTSDSKLQFVDIHLVYESAYIEYAHKLVESILGNVEFLKKYLSIILDSIEHNQFHDTCKFIHDTIDDPKFIFRLLFINQWFSEIVKMEKLAQSENFGPFHYADIVTNFRLLLSDYESELPVVCDNFLKCGILNFSFKFNRTETVVSTASYSRDGLDKNVLLTESISWIRNISSQLDNYIQVPEVIKLLCNFFILDNVDVDEKFKLCKNLLNLINVDFHCVFGHNLESCSCLFAEITTFFKHAKMVKSDYTDCKELFAYFLSNEDISLMNITNILRLMEIAQLLKANQSSTEQINDMIAETVQGRFESRYTNPLCTGPDMVEAIVFNKCNVNMLTLDASEARKHFINKNHREALQKSKCKTTKSKAIQSFQSHLMKEKRLTAKCRALPFQNYHKHKIKSHPKLCVQTSILDTNELGCLVPSTSAVINTITDPSISDQCKSVASSSFEYL